VHAATGTDGSSFGPGTMTKKDIAKQIALDAGLTQLQALEVVQRTFDEIIRSLVTEGRIELRNFGVFEVKRRSARQARNPRTGEKLVTPARNVVTFKPGKAMEDLIGGPEAEGETTPARAVATGQAAPRRGPGSTRGRTKHAAPRPATRLEP
jgi:nucleoid DNA-binding protein